MNDELKGDSTKTTMKLTKDNNKKLKRKSSDDSTLDYFKVSMEKAVSFQEKSLEIQEKVAS